MYSTEFPWSKQIIIWITRMPKLVYSLPRCVNFHANVQGRESNLLGIKAVHERRNISKELAWRSRVRIRAELRRPCGSFLFNFVLLVFPSSSSSSYSSSSSFPARGPTGSFFLSFVKETRWVRVSFTTRLCTTKRNAVKQKRAGVQARISIY